jgi:hypothetical protein
MRLVAASALLVASTAAASSGVIATDGGERPPALASLDRPNGTAAGTLDGRFGLMMGTAEVGDTGGFSVGFASGIGYRVRDVVVRGTFDFYRAGDDDVAGATNVRRGRALRFGGALRYSFVSSARASSVLADVWGELGGGVEHVEWRAGGVLDRPSGSLAFGLDLGGRYASDHRRSAGAFLAVRTFVAAPPGSDAMPTCGGPCDRATRPGMDVSTFFEMGVLWGR